MQFPTQMYIGGRLTGGSGARDVINPATEEIVATVATAMEEAQRALVTADRAFPLWVRAPIAERQEWMHRLRAEVVVEEEMLRLCVHHEMGKPWSQTHEDWDRLVVLLDFYAAEIAQLQEIGLPDREGTYTHRLVHEPAGVARAFLAWNFPLLNLAFKIGPAMASGCPLIVRPSEQTPASAYAVGAPCARVGRPAGVVQILCTDGYDVADALTASTIPQVVTLIGSTRTGEHIMRTGASSIKRYSMDLGGNAPVLVFENADLDLAADIVCGVKFPNAGQICIAPNRVYLARGVRDAFRDRVLARARAATVGCDRDADITTGPVIDGRARARIKGLIDEAVAGGAQLLARRPPATLEQGALHRAHGALRRDARNGLIPGGNLRPDRQLDPLRRRKGSDRHGQRLRYRRSDGYHFTRDLARADRYAAALRYGEVQINGVKYEIDLPHGGIGQWKIGHDCSALALEDYLVIKRITRAPEPEAAA